MFSHANRAWVAEQGKDVKIRRQVAAGVLIGKKELSTGYHDKRIQPKEERS